MNEMDTAGVTWSTTKTRGPRAVARRRRDLLHLVEPREMSANVVTPPSQVLTDVANGNLADVVWVMPTGRLPTMLEAPMAPGIVVGSVVNAIGGSQYWGNTAIFITWTTGRMVRPRCAADLQLVRAEFSRAADRRLAVYQGCPRLTRAARVRQHFEVYRRGSGPLSRLRPRSTTHGRIHIPRSRSNQLFSFQ